MKSEKYIVKLNSRQTVSEIGNKANSLLFLRKNKCTIPETFVVTTQAFHDSFSNRKDVLAQLEEEIGKLPNYSYAVRSSTNIEDSENYSHAGQFESIIDVQGAENLLHSIENVWKSSLPNRQDEYKVKTGDSVRVSCAVILQQYIDAKIAGVSFSKNPVNNRNEIIIEAIEGKGENLVQKGETPHRWIFSKNRLNEGNDKYNHFELIRKVAQKTAFLKRRYGNHVDIEWVFDGKKLYFLQLRSITADAGLTFYSNRLIQEMLPGQIKPLVWSVNIPLVIGTKINIYSKLVGKTTIQPHDLAKSFYSRIYLNVTNLANVFKEFGVPAEKVEEMMLNEAETKHSFKPGLKTLKHTFRIIKFIRSVLKFEKFFLKEFSELEILTFELSEKISNPFEVTDYEDYIQELYPLGKRLTYLNFMIPMLMRVYNKRFVKKLKSKNVDYKKVSFNHDFPELEELSPQTDMLRIKEMIEKIAGLTDKDKSSYTHFESLNKSADAVNEIERFIHKFGHFSESGNDISYKKWEENKEYVFKMILESENINTQQEVIPFNNLEPHVRNNKKIRKAYLRAGRFKVYREKISSLYIKGFGLFRTVFLQIAERFVNEGILDDRDDIFYLNREEIDELLLGREAKNYNEIKKKVRDRKREMEESKDLILPSVIFGEVAPILERGSIKNFKGISTSSGSYKGVTKIVKNTAEFEKVNRGDVVVIPFSDVSWTPVLLKAGAIVSESGGMLSHCSIIAREMGIPSLVSVDNACSLNDDLHVTVNGSNGILTVHEYE